MSHVPQPPPYGLPHSPRPPQQRKQPIAVFIAIGVCVALVVGVYTATRKPKLPVRPPESAEQKYHDVVNAFSEGGVPNPADTAAIQKAFDNFVAAIAAKSNGVGDFLDADRMLREMQAQGFLTNIPRQEEQGFGRGLRQGVIGNVTNPKSPINFTRIQVRKVIPLPDPSEAVVYVRAWSHGGMPLKFRWWLKKSSSGWRFYDLEDLDGGMRITDAMGAAASTAMSNGQLPPWMPQVKSIQGVVQALSAGDFATAEQLLTAMEGVPFPTQFDAIRTVMRGILQVGKQEYEPALKSFDKAQALHNDLPLLHYLRAVVYNNTNRPELAIASAQKYIDLLGDDAKAYAAIGQAHEALKRPDRAIEAYRKAVADDPTDAELRAALTRVQSESPTTTTKPTTRP